MNFVEEMMYKFLALINILCPKKDKIIFNSFPDASGNALALYEYILKDRKDIQGKYSLVWIVSTGNVEKTKELLFHRTGVAEHKVIEKKSVKGVLYFFLSKYIVSTHGFLSKIKTSKKQTHINLWHGMPFKRIGKEVLRSKGEESPKADITISTSVKYQEIMAKEFDMSLENVLVTGQPCNDALFCKNETLKKIEINENFSKIIMWMPTYRKSIVGEIRQDGSENGFGVVSVLNEHFYEFDAILKANNYLLLIKPHPMDVLCTMKLPESENIRVILNSDLEKCYTQLYELLADVDVLWTDYSSVFVDFLITKKPMAFICDDMKVYQESRGFLFEPFREYLPGELIENYEQLIEYLNNMDDVNETWGVKRQEIEKLLNVFDDSNASKRVCDIIWGEKV